MFTIEFKVILPGPILQLWIQWSDFEDVPPAINKPPKASILWACQATWAQCKGCGPDSIEMMSNLACILVLDEIQHLRLNRKLFFWDWYKNFEGEKAIQRSVPSNPLETQGFLELWATWAWCQGFGLMSISLSPWILCASLGQIDSMFEIEFDPTLLGLNWGHPGPISQLRWQKASRWKISEMHVSDSPCETWCFNLVVALISLEVKQGFWFNIDWPIPNLACIPVWDQIPFLRLNSALFFKGQYQSCDFEKVTRLKILKIHAPRSASVQRIWSCVHVEQLEHNARVLVQHWFACWVEFCMHLCAWSILAFKIKFYHILLVPTSKSWWQKSRLKKTF